MPPIPALLTISYLSAYTLHHLPSQSLTPTSSILSTTGILFAFSSICYAFYSIVLYHRFFSPLRHLPTVPGQPFVGVFNTITRQPTGVPQREWINKYPNDGIIRYMHLFNAERMLITKPTLVKEVLVEKSYLFIKPKRTQSFLKRLLGDGVLIAEGDEHKRQRKLLMPAFAFRHIKDLYPLFWAKSCTLTTALQKEIAATTSPANPNPSIEIGTFASRATLDIIGAAGMDHSFDAIANPHNTITQAYKRALQFGGQGRMLMFLSMTLPPWLVQRLPTERNKQFWESRRMIWETCENLVQKKKASIARGDKEGLDIISVALRSGGFSDMDLVNQMLTFMAAGHETTASSLQWVLYVLSKNPEMQSRLRAEIRANLPSPADLSTTSITSSQLDNNLPYLHAICNETFRFYPPVPMTIREAGVDTTIGGIEVRKGTTVIISSWALHHSKDVWGEDANQFKPERWMKEKSRSTSPDSASKSSSDSKPDATKDAYAFTTFIHGPRSCIGEKFARAELATLVAAVIGRFEVSLVPGQETGPEGGPRLKGGITARPQGGLKLWFKEVEGW